MQNPCWKCSDRSAGCHGKCEKYKAWKVELDKVKNAVEYERLKMVPIKNKKR